MADDYRPLRLDEAGLRAAREHLDDGAVTPAYGPWRDDIVKLLNGALATELICVLRYRRHHFMTALGRLTAVEKPRKAVKSRPAGRAKASGRV